MAVVSAVQSTPTQQPLVQSGSAAKTQSDYDTFLTLLVTQLRNQDPTQPTDHSELLAQLASFSSVEQQTKTNDKLDQLLAVMSLDRASSLIGMHLTTDDGLGGIIQSITLDGSQTLVTLDNGQKLPLTSGATITDPGNAG